LPHFFALSPPFSRITVVFSRGFYFRHTPQPPIVFAFSHYILPPRFQEILMPRHAADIAADIIFMLSTPRRVDAYSRRAQRCCARRATRASERCRTRRDAAALRAPVAMRRRDAATRAERAGVVASIRASAEAARCGGANALLARLSLRCYLYFAMLPDTFSAKMARDMQ
jgi:hypothetical protein